MIDRCEAHSISLERIEARAKDNSRRIEKLELDNVAINKLATALQVMAVDQKHISNNVNKLNSKVEEICARSGKWWETLVKAALIAAASGYVSWVLFGK